MSQAVPPPADRNIGRLIGGRYRLLAVLGQGGMGVVYRARHTEMEREFAVKLLSVPFTEEAARRFEREARAASRLSHSGCVSVTDFGQADDGAPFLVMEHLAGHSLAQVLRNAASLGVMRAARIADELLCVMEHAHREGVVHRDLKPENVMLVPGEDGREIVKILDFGLARLVGAGSEGLGGAITDVGKVFGTPEYLSPEQALGETADERADLYAIGVMLYEMLAGHRPFAGTSKSELISAHLLRSPLPLRQVASFAGISPELDAVVLRALAKRKDERWQTAADFRAALASVPISAHTGPMDGVPAHLPPSGFESTRPLVDKADGAEPPTGPRPEGTKELPATVSTPQRWWLVGLAIVALAVLVGLLLMTRLIPAERVRSLELASVRSAVDRGALVQARKEAEGLVLGYPRDAAVFVLLGEVLFADRQVERGLAAYREALRLDPRHTSINDALLENVRATLSASRLGEEAFALAESLGQRGGTMLEAFAKTTSDPRLARRAQQGARKAKRP